MFTFMNGADDLPGLSHILGDFKVNPPLLMLGTGRTQKGTVIQLDRLVLDRSNEVADPVIFTEFTRFPPGFSMVG